jgi:uncharacterized membrane protein YbhN (UPF0104 family)
VKDAAALYRFLAHEGVGRRLGLVVAVVAWFAVTWMSLVLALTVPVLLCIALVVQRRTSADGDRDELDELF